MWLFVGPVKHLFDKITVKTKILFLLCFVIFPSINMLIKHLMVAHLSIISWICWLIFLLRTSCIVFMKQEDNNAEKCFDSDACKI